MKLTTGHTPAESVRFRLFFWMLALAFILTGTLAHAQTPADAVAPVPTMTATANRPHSVLSVPAIQTVQADVRLVSSDSTAGKANKVVADARSKLGKPYRWGAAGPDKFDCSGLVQWAYKQVGINLPHSSGAQAAAGRKVSMNDLQPGDLLYRKGHIALYAGNGNVIYSPSKGDVVKERPLNKAGKFTKAVRILPDGDKQDDKSDESDKQDDKSDDRRDKDEKRDIEKVAHATAASATVPAGSTVSATSAKHGFKNWRCVAAKSNIRDPHRVRSGQVLILAPECRDGNRNSGRTAPDRSPDKQSDTKPRTASDGNVWDRLAQCESGGNWKINTGNGYYGGLQFSPRTWKAYGGIGLPHQASREQQIAIATKVRDARGGYGDWPACSRKLKLPR